MPKNAEETIRHERESERKDKSPELGRGRTALRVRSGLRAGDGSSKDAMYLDIDFSAP